jgi:hypothetical protein
VRHPGGISVARRGALPLWVGWEWHSYGSRWTEAERIPVAVRWSNPLFHFKGIFEILPFKSKGTIVFFFTFSFANPSCFLMLNITFTHMLQIVSYESLKL